jgi:hypothetical protein
MSCERETPAAAPEENPMNATRMISATRKPRRCSQGCCNSWTSRSLNHPADRKGLTRSAKRREERTWRRAQY